MLKIRLLAVAALSLAATFVQVAHAVVPLTGATAVAAGGSHSCALTSGGGVKCWGDNLYGQLGNGATTNSNVAVDVTGLTAGVAAMATGYEHACALTNGGGVKCWGANNYGQLGNGTMTHSMTPVDVTGLETGVVAIAAGFGHSCALTSGGGLKCWGGNESGQLGNGTTSDALIPVDVIGLTTGVTAITAGKNAGGFNSASHTCALTTGGGVKCWGDNRHGQLGDGTTTHASTPVDVTGLPAGVAAVSAGSRHTCALTTGGGAKCWGANPDGQLGNGTTAQALTPVDVAGLASGVAVITAGGGHTCALTIGSAMKCWGYNFFGQLGDGTTAQALTPIDVPGLTAGVSAISAGRFHSCAVTAGSGTKCWGRNDSGQVGNGMATQAATAVEVIGLSAGATAILSGGAHNCALTTGGGAKCWGFNNSGTLGNGTTMHAPTPVDVTGLTAGVAAITTGDAHTCALTLAGGMKCWGDNGAGQLGNGTTTPALTAVDVSGLTTGVAAIAAGGRHTCALTTGGGVKCWGSNFAGQLGNGTTTDALTAVDAFGLTTGVAAIAAGGRHTCALTTSRGVKCWGDNGAGQLGNGTTMPALTAVDVSGLTTGVAAIAAGDFHTCALTTGGGVKCWGSNFAGQLGNGTTTDALTAVDVTGLTSDVAAIAGGGYHTCAVTTGGGVKCWGSNSSGQLGNGTTTHALTAVNVTGLNAGVATIAAGGGHTCALTTFGGMKCWGLGTFGQLGNGFSTFVLTPQVVVVPSCADFTDVDPNSAFCANVQWLRNRAVTLGCASTTQYCPGDSVIRLAMAAFMNRLGTSLTAIVLPRQVATGALDPGASPVVCATADRTESGFQRRVFLDGVFTATAVADVGLATDPVVSFDSGVTWLPVASQAQRGLVRANRWGNLRSLGSFDVAPGQPWRAGLRVSRSGLPSTATLSDSGCNLRVRIDNRNGALQPF